MERVEQYRGYIKQLLKEYASYKSLNKTGGAAIFVGWVDQKRIVQIKGMGCQYGVGDGSIGWDFVLWTNRHIDINEGLENMFIMICMVRVLSELLWVV
jgi:hypothetical protein